MVALDKILTDAAAVGLKLQDDQGRMPAGRNGPWNDPETPVRNTAHWAITFLKTYQLTGERTYRVAGEQCLSYLTDDSARPCDETFHCRYSTEKDQCNGLIGQAWVLEALEYGGTVLDRPGLIDLAESVFLAHPFVSRLPAWKTVGIDGSVGSIKLTFNQQLWFAAVGGLLARHERTADTIGKRIEHFLDNLVDIIGTYRDGLIHHQLKVGPHPGKQAIIAKQNLKDRRVPTWLRRIKSASRADFEERCVGYHSFNLYAFAMLAETYPDHEFWKSDVLRRVRSYSLSENYRRDVDKNDFSYTYNCTGIEVAYAIRTLWGDSEAEAGSWINRQLEKTSGFDPGYVDHIAADPDTLLARTYELCRLVGKNQSDRSDASY